jgi:hypothetical protein
MASTLSYLGVIIYLFLPSNLSWKLGFTLLLFALQNKSIFSPTGEEFYDRKDVNIDVTEEMKVSIDAAIPYAARCA